MIFSDKNVARRKRVILVCVSIYFKLFFVCLFYTVAVCRCCCCGGGGGGGCYNCCHCCCSVVIVVVVVVVVAKFLSLVLPCGSRRSSTLEI